MDQDSTDQNFVAPLTIRKASHDEVDDAHHDPYTTEENYNPRPRFQNFLRASYPFQPAATPSPSTVTLGLNAGDVILVHSIHTNGWADGTLLETGARGWLPTNYCEAYDYATMRPLLKALTEFWDIVRIGTETNDAIIHSHDYMRGMVAGVRFLLEKSDCLTRESMMIKQHDSVRKIRKSLLADLSNLVKTAKQLQQVAASGASLNDIEEVLDDMLLKAFHVVTRAVSFFDAWSDLISFSRNAASTEPLSPTFPVPGSAHMNSWQSRATDSSDQTARRLSRQSFSEDTMHSARHRPLSVMSSRRTLTHRMSYTGRVNQSQTSNLASDKLNNCYDAFLGVLASFLGSHMQSRSSSELLLTTQMAVKACRRLLSVVDIIVDHNMEHAEQLIEAKDAMCDKITELVLAAKQVFRPLHSTDEDIDYLPAEGNQLVTAATACVSGAGRCVAKARVILEDMGDFELDETIDADDASSPVEDPQSSVVQDFTLSPDPNAFESSEPPLRPRLAITTTLPQRQGFGEISPTPDTSTFWTPLAGPLHDSPASTTSSVGNQGGVHLQNTGFQFGRPFTHDVAPSSGSESTLLSSTRNSGPSFVSETSTRATSPDRNNSQQQELQDMEKSTSSDEFEEGEDEIMQHMFAHELLFNAEARVVGGSLDAIVERLTAHDSTPDAFFVSTIYLTFRLFTTPAEFLACLTNRFSYVDKAPKIAQPVRLRVYNVLKGWLETHWRHDCDEAVLPQVVDFARHTVLPILPPAGKRLLELVETVARTHQPPVPRVLSAMGKTNTATTDYSASDLPMPPPVLSRAQYSALKQWKATGATLNILDFDPMELARQITIKVSTLFCSILPEELLATEFTKQTSSLAVNVRGMAQLSTDLANLVADSILQLEEAKKRAVIIKQWIKVASKCLELNNYDTLMAIVCSINSSTILRLKRTWDLISQKTKTCFEGLKKVVDVSKNYSTLRQRVAGHVPPCIPFVGMYLTDLTFVDHGNPANRELKTGNETLQVINLDKHMKTARIISDLQRFQAPYRLSEVSELQTWLQDELIRVRAAGERNFQNHYRRSLVLEPRERAQPRPTTVGTFAAITGKEKFDFLAWTHIGKDKITPVTS